MCESMMTQDDMTIKLITIEDLEFRTRNQVMIVSRQAVLERINDWWGIALVTGAKSMVQ